MDACRLQERRGGVWQVLDDEFVAGLDNIF